MAIQKIGVLTGGGDCPGLNPAIKAVTKKALECGVKVFGLKEGWLSLMDKSINPVELNLDLVRHIDRLGGTILGTSRTNPYKLENGFLKVKENFLRLGLDALVAIGGEDTLGVAHKLYEDLNLKVVGIPKTIDGDLLETEYCLGFMSAIEVIQDSVDALRSTAESHSRVFVVEVMGRHSGHLAIEASIASAASIVLIPEESFDIDHVCKLLLKRKERGVRYSIVLVSEGAKAKGLDLTLSSKERDAFGHVRLGGISEWLSEEIQKRAGLETRNVVLSHLQRGGKPCAFDRKMGFCYGIASVEALIASEFGKMVALKEGKIVLSNIKDAVKALNLVNVEQNYDKDLYKYKQSILGKFI